MQVAVTFHFPTADPDGDRFDPSDVRAFLLDTASRVEMISVIVADAMWKIGPGVFTTAAVLRCMCSVNEDVLEQFVEHVEAELKRGWNWPTVWIEVDGKPSIR